tara:strand:+ start:448 stop:774 length:327 start_codon:yes stop_codon:yes gene_type:complete
MSLQTLKYANTGTAIQVGGLKTADAKITTANNSVQFDATQDRIIEIQDYSGSVVWFAVKSTDDIVNPNAANGNACIPPYGITRPFILPKGFYIEASGTVNIRSLDIEN